MSQDMPHYYVEVWLASTVVTCAPPGERNMSIQTDTSQCLFIANPIKCHVLMLAVCLHWELIKLSLSTLHHMEFFKSANIIQKNFIITQIAMFYLLLCFDHHRWPSLGTECSVVTAR